VSNQFDIRDDQPLEAAPPDGQPIPGASFMRDTSPPLDTATFNPVAWVQGMRPNRRTVKLYLGNDLVGQLDELADRIETAGPDVDVSADVEEFERLRQEYLAGHTYWVVEGRSSEWITKCWEDIATQKRIRLNKQADTDNQKDRLELILGQLSQQIVEVRSPDGQTSRDPISVEVLRSMFTANEREFNKLVYAMSDVNQIPSDRSEALTRNFSQRSSTARSGAAS
jgi:hypothetical protein